MSQEGPAVPIPPPFRTRAEAIISGDRTFGALSMMRRSHQQIVIGDEIVATCIMDHLQQFFLFIQASEPIRPPDAYLVELDRTGPPKPTARIPRDLSEKTPAEVLLLNNWRQGLLMEVEQGNCAVIGHDIVIGVISRETYRIRLAIYAPIDVRIEREESYFNRLAERRGLTSAAGA